MDRSKPSQQRILHRLKIARGHMEKVLKMAESGEYCIDVIHQSQAVQSALKEADAAIMENHLNTCVVDHIKKGQSKKSIEEIMKVFRKNP